MGFLHPKRSGFGSKPDAKGHRCQVTGACHQLAKLYNFISKTYDFVLLAKMVGLSACNFKTEFVNLHQSFVRK